MPVDVSLVLPFLKNPPLILQYLDLFWLESLSVDLLLHLRSDRWRLGCDLLVELVKSFHYFGIFYKEN